ncbi:MAG: DNA gyrase subunit A [Bacteroidetes bacterium]|jgi:DNA gyrase subunit A|nr:DNA gyrase subunit A [Bacteroidota bacterium]MBP6639079.1 DNA gyrase subunit A [Bacteroidia bacterium]
MAGKIIERVIEEEMKSAYIDYSMSVIVSRALPDVRDGLKPVHRRVLYGMTDLGLGASRPYKKSARIVGEVLGKYHPHGDSSVYDAMVRMAQDWSLRYPLVDGQGNFGSIDGDPPAAMRYTEARLRRIAEEMLADIDKETVDFRPNFDDSLKEPSVLPAKVPNLLINGASGIAVGMATNMAPHNITEVITATIAYIENRDITIAELTKIVIAPDFPTGGIIYGYEGVMRAFETGRGRVVVRARARIEEQPNGREWIIIEEIPYQVNKGNLLVGIGQLINEKKLEGISDLRDESDRDGMRIVFEIKRDAMANVVLNHLYKYTPLQQSFGVNNVALVNGRPMTLNLKEQIKYYVIHRHEVVVRRTEFLLREAEKRAHILEGLLIALDHLDEVIALIRASQSPDVAREGLMTTFGLSEIQSRAILDMRLQRLTGLERDKIREEYNELMKIINYYKEVLASEPLRMEIITAELIEMREKYGDERRTSIEYAAGDMSMEDLIPNEEVIITVSHEGYIKRTLTSEIRSQKRGGRGAKAAGTKDTDFIEHLFTAWTHNYLIFFTQKGKCYWLRVYEVPEGSKQSKGRAIQNLIQIDPDDKIKTFITVQDLKNEDALNNTSVIMCTRQGVIKKTLLEAYSRPRANGINAININDDDMLLEAKLVKPGEEVVIGLRSGRAIRFPEDQTRNMGRSSTGVRGVTLAHKKDAVVGMVIIHEPNATLLVVSENGFGKRSSIEDYRRTKRGGKGVKTINITEKTGDLISIMSVSDTTNDLMIITKNGITIRTPLGNIREAGRATQGVRLIKLNDGDQIAAVTKVMEAEEEEVELVEGADAVVSGPEATVEGDAPEVNGGDDAPVE